MSKIISLSDRNTDSIKSVLRFRLRICPMIDGKLVYDATLIVLENLKSCKILEVTSFSNLFLENKLINIRINSRINLAKTIVMFLNYIHFDRELIERNNKNKKQQNLYRIEDLTLDDFNLFLDDYKKGNVGKEVYEGEQKAKNTIIQIEQRLARFGYYLVHNYNMTHLRKTDFRIVLKKRKVNGELREYNSIQSPFKIIQPKERITKNRLELVSFYAISELIKIASEIKPMIALAIATGAFSGLRGSETCNISYFNTEYTYLKLDLQEYKIDLREKPILRSDGVNVGEIKQKEIAYVHPSFLPMFDVVLNFHENYRKQLNRINKYGAMFLNRDGKAMTEQDYNYSFAICVEELKRRLFATGDPRAISEAKLMQTLNFTPHTLRFFFSQYLSKLPNITIFDIATFRRDKTLDAALIYIRSNPHLIDDNLKAVQEDLIK